MTHFAHETFPINYGELSISYREAKIGEREGSLFAVKGIRYEVIFSMNNNLNY
jgi:hypothetical protein